MSSSAILRGLLVALFVAAAGVCPAVAQKQDAPPVSRAAFWSNAEPEAEVYLVESGSTYQLAVISKQEFQVFYRTRINSVEPVEKPLAPVSGVPDGVRHYRFQHNFTKMTLWMALEFKLEGKSVPALTRTFLNDIFEVVPNGHFDFGGAKKP